MFTGICIATVGYLKLNSEFIQHVTLSIFSKCFTNVLISNFLLRASLSSWVTCRGSASDVWQSALSLLPFRTMYMLIGIVTEIRPVKTYIVSKCNRMFGLLLMRMLGVYVVEIFTQFLIAGTTSCRWVVDVIVYSVTAVLCSCHMSPCRCVLLLLLSGWG